MQRRSRLSSSRLAWAAPALLAACSSPEAAPARPASLGLVMRAPAGLLDQATAVDLVIAGATKDFTCDAATGATSKPAAGQPDRSAFAMTRTGCAAAGQWCVDVTLPLDPERQLVFAVSVREGGKETGRGCATAAVSADPLAVPITIHKVVAPAVCGNGTLETGEDCDETSASCDATCRTKELALSSGPVGAGHPPSAAWQVDPSNPYGKNPYRAVWQSTTSDPYDDEITLRVLDEKLEPLASPASLTGPTVLAGTHRALQQRSPAIAALPGADAPFAVAFEDDTQGGTVSVAVLARDTNPKNNAADLQRLGAAKGVAPAIAGGPTPGAGSLALAVWADPAASTIGGRIVNGTTVAKVGGELDLGAVGADAPKVAGSADGWVVVWHGQGTDDADDVLAAKVDAQGTVGAPIQVNDAPGVQTEPAVARLASGGWAVVWRDGGSLRMQRFTAADAKVAGDQDAPVNDAGGAPANPAIAAGTSGGAGFYAIGWEDGATGEIRGRFADGAQGWLYAVPTGGSGELVASRPGIAGQRKRPTVAIGGAGFVAFAWQDDADPDHGIFARRLPLPTGH